MFLRLCVRAPRMRIVSMPRDVGERRNYNNGGRVECDAGLAIRNVDAHPRLRPRARARAQRPPFALSAAEGWHLPFALSAGRRPAPAVRPERRPKAGVEGPAAAEPPSRPLPRARFDS